MLASWGLGTDLLANPTILGNPLAADEARHAGLGYRRVVEREIEQKDTVSVGATEIEARTHHANLVANAQAAAAGETVGAGPVALDLIGVGVVNYHRLAP